MPLQATRIRERGCRIGSAAG